MDLRYLALLAAWSVSAVSVADGRTWRDSTGKFAVEAEFIEVRKDKVKLRKKDGRRITIPVSQLSAADQRFIASVIAGKELVSDKVKNALARLKIRTDWMQSHFNVSKKRFFRTFSG